MNLLRTKEPKVISVLMLTACSLFFGFDEANAQNYLPDQNPKIKVKPVVEMKAYPFQLGEVKLLASPFQQAMQKDTAYLMAIEPDRLLSQFRSHAGLQPKAPKYGGWESDGLAGHTLGHYLSAIALEYSSTKNKKFLDRANYIVDELAECQQARKTGYVGAIPKEDSVFNEVSKGNIRSHGFDLNGAWSPWYTVHKVMAGLLDVYLYCGNEKALQVELKMADWTGNLLKDLSDEQLQKMLFCEYGGMNEVLVNTYALTGEKKYLEMSYLFHDKLVLDPLAEQKDILPGKHSNTQIPKVIGTVRRYEVTADKKDLQIGEFFWSTIVDHHTYAPGGNSNYEYLSQPDHLNEKLTDNTMETCNTYNMLKLTRHLFALQPSGKLMDFYERALYNHILASQNRQDGMMCYFVPLRMGTRKEFSDQFNTFTCCVGSGIENHVKYGESIYFKGSDGSLFINLFIPSELNWAEKKINLTMNSDIPASDNISIVFNNASGLSVPVMIRKPYWVKGTVPVKLNGKGVNNIVEKNGYLVVERKWKRGDKLELQLPATLHSMSLPDNANRQAFFYGPVLLAGNLGTIEPDPMQGIPVIVTDEQDLTKLLEKKDAKKLVFQTSGSGYPKDVELKPFYEFDVEHYTVYWDVFTRDAWKTQQKLYEEMKQKAFELEASTTDYLRVGEMQPERDHNFTGEELEFGEAHTRKFRVANNGKSFSFDLKVIDGFNYKLVATYWGMDNRGRNFEIVVDGEVVATVDLNKYKESKFYDIEYRLPLSATSGKKTVRVTFKAKPGNQAGPVYGVRIVKESRVN
jgi:uncharacterized protein